MSKEKIIIKIVPTVAIIQSDKSVSGQALRITPNQTTPSPHTTF